MNDRELDGPVPESIRLFSICSAMEFNALPVAGGIYDQHPKLIEEWMVLFAARAEKQKKDRKDRADKQLPPRRRRRTG